MNTFIVQGVSQSVDGSYLVVLSEKTQFKGRRTRKECWTDSDNWYPGNEGPMHFGRHFLESSDVRLPIDAKTFSELGLFVGAEVELSLKVTSNFVR